jgi:hypothetical protein
VPHEPDPSTHHRPIQQRHFLVTCLTQSKDQSLPIMLRFAHLVWRCAFLESLEH